MALEAAVYDIELTIALVTWYRCRLNVAHIEDRFVNPVLSANTDVSYPPTSIWHIDSKVLHSCLTCVSHTELSPQLDTFHLSCSPHESDDETAITSE